MPAPLALLLLPGPGELDATLASVRDELPAGAPVLALSEAEPAEILAAAELVAFARAGDRWLSGTLEPRMRVLRAHPSAALSVAGHLRTDPQGREGLHVPAPRVPLDPVELLLRASVEAAAVLVRTSALDAAALALLARPHGDAVLWSRLACTHGLVASGEIAAAVAFDPDRHGHAPEAGADVLLEAVAAGTADGPGDATVRRELLRRLYLEGDATTDGLALADVLGVADDARVAAIVEDLQWALERQRDALAAERIRWADGEVADEDALGQMTDAELIDLRGATSVLGAEIARREAMLRRLEADVYRRDAMIAEPTGEPLGAHAGEDA